MIRSPLFHKYLLIKLFVFFFFAKEFHNMKLFKIGIAVISQRRKIIMQQLKHLEVLNKLNKFKTQTSFFSR